MPDTEDVEPRKPNYAGLIYQYQITVPRAEAMGVLGLQGWKLHTVIQGYTTQHGGWVSPMAIMERWITPKEFEAEITYSGWEARQNAKNQNEQQTKNQAG